MADIDEALPKYLRISGFLREQIERGELPPGSEVPSERELAARWKVARPTAAKALNALRTEGIVRSFRGSGTYVADRPPLLREQAPRYEPSFADDASARVLEAALSAGPKEVTDALGLPRDSRVVMRKSLGTSDSGATELWVSWFPGELAESAAGLLEAERLPGGAPRYLESVLGRGVALVRERVGARLATAEERRHLALAHPAAVLVRHRTVHDVDGVVIEFDEVVHPPGGWILQREYSARS